MKQILKIALLCLLCATLLCGCTLFGEKPTEDESVHVDYDEMVSDPVDVSLDTCITEQKVSELVGAQVKLLGVYEDGTQAVYMSDDATCQVNVNLINQTRAVFDSNVSGADVAPTQVEGLGEAAYWYAETGEMVVYANGYSLGVAVMVPDVANQMTYAQQIAAVIVSTLQGAQ